MFENILPGKNKEERIEKEILNKQLTASKEQAMMGVADNPQADMAWLEQRRERDDLVKWQQNLAEELFNLELDLRRKYINSEGQIVSTGEGPACNEKYIQMIRTNCRPLLSRNMIMTSFNEERILQILKRSMAAIVRTLCVSYDKYGIDYFDISYVLATIKNYVMPAPFRALNGGEKKYLGTVNKRIETYSGNIEQENKKGILSFRK